MKWYNQSTILRFLISCLIFTSFLTSQWISFDLSKADASTFVKQVKPTIISSVLTGGRSTLLNLTPNQRLGITVSIPIGLDIAKTSYQSNPFIHPLMVEGQFLITENLVLKGKMNMFSNGEESVQAAGYGCNYFANSWFSSVSIGWLEGPKHLRIRYVDTAITIKRSLFNMPVLFGAGFNKYKGNILGLNSDNMPGLIENSITYFITGTELQFAGIDIELQTQIHSKFVQFNVTIFRLFF